MTREEAIELIRRTDSVGIVFSETHEALDMAIKALEQESILDKIRAEIEQEPCEDAISRQAVEKITWEEPSYTDALNVLTEVRDKVRALPPVNPQELKTGHWIYDDEYSDCFDVTYNCSCCKRAIIVPYEARNEVYKNYPYCHCGAKMESEDKE